MTTLHVAGLPTAGVDTLVLQTFSGQNGNVYTVDNMSLTAIPEPSHFMILAGVFSGSIVFTRRRRRLDKSWAQ